jgi:hypothetical protein
LEFWGDEPERGLYNDAAVIAHHLVDSYERGDLSEFPTAFALLERCLTEGDKPTRDLVMIGLIEAIQNIASHRPFGPGVFATWLSPASRAAWDEVIDWWDQLAKAKAAGLLGPRPGQPAAPVVDPGDVQDPALRRMVEQLYRN